MLHRKNFFLLLIPFVAFFVRSSSASTIYVRYFESADFFLTTERFQRYSFSALQGEEVTLVVYGLEEGFIPAVTVFDINGVTLAENLNPSNSPVAVIELTAPANGLYTALISRLTDTGGLLRVMLFEGEPFNADLSFLDTVDPFLPSRAYFASGDSQEPIAMTLTVLDDGDENTPIPDVFASRGTEITPPPLEERLSGIEQKTWQNDDGEIFYTLNVRSIPEEALPTSRKLGGYLSYAAQVLDWTVVQLDLGNGTPSPQFLPRFECKAIANLGARFLAGPGVNFIVFRILPQATPVEIIGSSGDFWLVVDSDSNFGGSFVAKSQVQLISALNSLDCQRGTVQTTKPLPTPQNTIQQNPDELEDESNALPSSESGVSCELVPSGVGGSFLVCN